MRKFFLAGAAALLAAGVAQAQTGEAGPKLVIEVADADGNAKGVITLGLFADVAPQHVERLVTLANEGAYDGVVFHRVIEGFMAQTGDVQFGRHGEDLSRAGMGGSDLGSLKAEFSDRPFEAGTVGMARAQDPDSANSQFFIDLAPAPFLDGDYTVVGELVDGWEVLESIKRGDPNRNGTVSEPDYMKSVTVDADGYTAP